MLSGEGKFGFVEFRTIAEATSCMALNNIELGGKQLRIERPRDYQVMPDHMSGELKAAGLLGSTSVAPDGVDLLAANSAPAPAVPPPPPASGPPLDTSNATPVVTLSNMVTEAELGSTDEMGEILEDTKGECSKHGGVDAIVSPKPGVGGDDGTPLALAAVQGRVFVKFGAVEAAVACATELHGKMFDGRTVTAAFLDLEAFAALQALDCYSA